MSSSSPHTNNSNAPPAAWHHLSLSAVETILQDETKGTVEMRASLRGLQTVLTCPLCTDLFQDPVTFTACGHAFCRHCMDTYSCDHWKCPVQGCGLPFSWKGSFRRVHPELQTSIDSFTILCQTLQQAKPYWWKDGQNNHWSSTATTTTTTNNSNAQQEGMDKDDDQDMIDLMACSSSNPDDENYNQHDKNINDPQNSFLPFDSDDDDVFQSARQE